MVRATLRRHDPRSHPLTFVRKGTIQCLRRACTFVGSRRFCQLRKFARKANTVVVVDKTKGNGSHAVSNMVLG